MSYFGFLIGNTMMTFMWHHSLPALVRPVRPEKNLNAMILSANTVAFTVIMIISITAVLAFGELTNDCKDHYPCKI
jgi:hypothetical protein